MKPASFIVACAFGICCISSAHAQLGKSKAAFNYQDTLRGSLRPERTWWDVQKYAIAVTPDYNKKSISATTTIYFKKNGNGVSSRMQIDLQQPMILDTAWYVTSKGSRLTLPFQREGNVYWLNTSSIDNKKMESDSIKFVYHGTPREAIRPPWDGGWIWKKDQQGRPWMSVACQGLGASVWYPCKDYQGDEPDRGALLTMRVPDSLVAVGNGRLKSKLQHSDHTTSWTWEVKNPINNYTIIPYIGKYVNWTENFPGKDGNLDCNYWVLDYDLEKSKAQFGRDVKRMLSCFESWFGPYPFYDDSYKLVEAPHLGMEHQSAVAYGNQFMNGYLGSDLSGTGQGKDWDYIIVHESGHEWFANNITTNDIADMWVHEGFTTYSEVLFVECQRGKAAGDEYCQGQRRGIGNRSTIIGPYGVNKEGSQDMYPKGANLLHTVREVIHDDVLFRNILIGLNKEFYHRTITSKDIEDYISKKAKTDFTPVFNQYLRNIAIPVLEYKMEGNVTSYRWANCIDEFNMPIRVGDVVLKATTKWQQARADQALDMDSISKNYYITVKKV